MRYLAEILQGIILGVLLFLACYQFVLNQQNSSLKTEAETNRIFTYQFY